jgi:3-oxoacyl-[acyl-carrier protein] reductase
MGKLDNKIALVTGAGRGIGSAIARRLAGAGAHVIVNYSRSRAEAEALVAQIRTDGGSASTIGADIADLDAITAMFTQLAAEHPRIDILVNNAGRGSGGMPTLDTSTPEQFESMIGLNMRGLFFVTQGAVRMMPDGGRVINISSTSTMARVPGLSIYAGTKAAVEAFTRIWAAELAARRITVNAVLPGITDTDMIKNNLKPDVVEQIAGTIPLGRIGTPRDIAAAVAFLASEDGDWITGQNLVSAGGAA